MIRYLKWFADKIRVDRRNTYTFSIKPNEELSLEFWVCLVKRRAGYKCENKSSRHSKILHAHHIKPKYQGGKNNLKNGKCLCSLCHILQLTSLQENGEYHKSLCQVFGIEKGTEILHKLWDIKTNKSRKEELMRHLEQIDPDKLLEIVHKPTTTSFY